MAEPGQALVEGPVDFYDRIAPWWPILVPPDSKQDTANLHLYQMQAALGRPLRSLLELGSGAGLMARFFPAAIEVQLVDRSAAMLEVSRTLNPGRAHHREDLRTLRLNRTFDAVFLHDVVMYLTGPEDLAQALATARAHLAPGGVLLVVPDAVVETWAPGEVTGGSDAPDGRAARLLEWHWDPTPGDQRVAVDLVAVLREPDGRTEVLHDRHTFALLSRAGWREALRAAGFEPKPPARLPGLPTPVAFVGVVPTGEAAPT